MNVLRRFVFVSFILFSILGACAFASSNVSPSEPGKADHKLVIAGDLNYPPFEFVSKDNLSNYRGLNVDVMRAISIEAGVEIELLPMTWDDARKALKEGKVDAIQGMIKTRSREIIYDFSEPYYISEQVIFVRTENKDITSLEDLKGKRIALQKGDMNEEVINQSSGIELLYFPDQESALRALISGEVSATLGNKATGIYHLQRLNLAEKVKTVGDTLSVNEYCVAVKKGNEKTLKIINKGLQLVKEKGTLVKINHKWFGESIPDNTQWKTLLILVGMLATGLLTIVLFVFLINKRLQEQIEWRTKELQNFTHILEKKDAQKWHILNNISNGIVVFNNDGEVGMFNQMAVQLIGIPLSLNDSWSDLKICQQIGIEVFQTALEGNMDYKGTFSYLSPANNTIYLKYDLTPITYSDHHNELIFLLSDVTQDKIFHDVIHQNDKMSSLGRMSASIAHELRNPLNAIKQYVDLMPKKLDQPKFMEKAMSILPSELARLNKIIEGLLDYSKFTDSEKEVLVLKQIINETVALLKVEFLNRRVRFTSSSSEVLIFADPKQLKQILINLLINAIEALPEEGGEIDVTVDSTPAEVHLYVKDSGSGISPEALKMVFEPYYTTKKTGYGMGLAITKQLVEENNGTVEIISSAVGTTVKLSFPKYNAQ